MRKLVLMLLVACKSSSTPSNPPPPPQPQPVVTTDAAPVEPTPAPVEPTPAPAPDAAPATPPSTPAGIGENCGPGDRCDAGLACVKYYGIAGPRGPEVQDVRAALRKGEVVPEPTALRDDRRRAGRGVPSVTRRFPMLSRLVYASEGDR